MKLVLVLLLVLSSASVRAQPPVPPPRSAPTDYLVNTADISAIEFETGIGLLQFDVKGQHFAYRGHCQPSENWAASVAAGSATLAELRRATTVTLRVEYSNELNNPYRINNVNSIAFHYDSLKQ